MCQCPLSGFLHFYVNATPHPLTFLDGCQCPLSGFLHFYIKLDWCGAKKNVCVNALYRAFSISTTICNGVISIDYAVSMPFIGLSPFLPIEDMPENIWQNMCQCPLSGFLHFYAPLWERPKMKHLQTRFCR